MIGGKLDIDSQDFDPNEYFMDLLKNNNLKQLVDKNLNIQSQIKSFDHDIQSMVSDNYSKFISSIDIVKKMKESIEGVEKKMEKLERSINRINDLAVKVDTTLETKRNEIKKLDLINKDLSGLRKLCEFPQLLNKELTQYKKKLNEIMTNYGRGKVSPLDFPKEILSKLNLRFLFRESAEYYLDCWSKLQKYKNEILIKPLYEESKIQIEEIKNILYALVFNKYNSGDEHRMILYNYLCFEADRTTTLKTFYRNLGDQYVTKLRKLFYGLDKQNSKLADKEYEIDLGDDEVVVVRPNSLVEDSIGVITQMSGQKKEFSVFLKFVSIKDQLIEKFLTDLSQKNFYAEIENLIIMLRSDIQFVVNKLSSIFDQKTIKLLQSNFVTLLRTIFEDVSRRLSGLGAPYILHRVVFEKFAQGFATIKTITDSSSYKTTFNSLQERFELQMLWLCQIACLKDIIRVFMASKKKSIKMYDKTKKNIKEMEAGSKNLDIFELNFDREMSNTAKQITQTILLSSINFVNDMKTVISLGRQVWNMRLSQMYGNFWRLTKSVLVDFGQGLNEDDLLEVPKSILFSIEASSQDERVSKSKVLGLIKNKVYYGLLEDLKQLRSTKDTIFMILLMIKVFGEIKGATFGGPLVESYEDERLGLFSVVFKDVVGDYEYESIESVKKFVSIVRVFYTKSFKHYYSSFIKKKKGEVQIISREVEPLIVELKLIIGTIQMIFSEEESLPKIKKGNIFEDSASNQTNILLAKQSKIIERNSMTSYNADNYINASLKSIMRTLLRLVRKERYSESQAKQVQADLSLLSDLIYEQASKDDEMILSGFYHEMIHSLKKRVMGELRGDSLMDAMLLETLCRSKKLSLAYLNDK